VSLILKLALIGCVAAPLLAAAFNSSRAAVAGAFYAALLAALIGMHIDPLAMGLSRVDDAMTASVCGLGLRPLR
jgi:MFS-type transporter involved in bile tolerance (Atg22 family)